MPSKRVMTGDTGGRVADVLANSVILWGAWMRVDSWYKGGELAPQPELARWRLHPERMLRELSIELREGTWMPGQWKQVPYPKKGARLRHYVMPTVRDQVAFMAHMVALGPILDSQVANFAFGNRWYRPIAWDRRKENPGWIQRPYPVLTDRTYLSYARSHGLFRRVAHWTVARMTKATLPIGSGSDRVQDPTDYDENELPPWTRDHWWKGKTNSSRAYWSALDIELAYPSVRLRRLATALDLALRKPANITQLFDGCPKPVMQALEVEEVRAEIGLRLAKALSGVSIDSCGIPPCTWCPPREHPFPEVTPEPYEGIPTGLAISGVLFNVALLEADRAICDYLGRTSAEQRGAIVRFADDMYVLSRSSDGLLSLIQAVHVALSGSEAGSLAQPNKVSNICLNLKKIRPDAVRIVVEEFLLQNCWHRCKEKKCGQPLPPKEKRRVCCISDWWAKFSKGSDLLSGIEREAIDKGDVGPFVTSLVERLSDMGTDTLRQRFDDGARDHLARLHELAKFDIEDEQVRQDTRRTFSVNRLVRAWLPAPRTDDDDEQRRELRQIRETTGFVLDRTPWKFALWRAVVRSAARRSANPKQKNVTLDNEASDWLINQLRKIACEGKQKDLAAWIHAWPEIDSGDGHGGEIDAELRVLYLSFLRTAFWRALAQVIRELQRHAGLETPRDGAIGWSASPALWTTRAVTEGCHEAIALSLSQIDKWSDVLYPDVSVESIACWSWEVDEFVGAILATHSTAELAEAWRGAVGPRSELVVPMTARLEGMPRTTKLLSTLGRLQQIGPRRSRKLDYWKLANVSLGHRDDQLGAVLFPASGQSRISNAKGDAKGALVAGVNLGCFDRIDLKLARRAFSTICEGKDARTFDALSLREYTHARSVLVGQTAEKVREPTVHRLLWGKPKEKRDLSDWQMAGWETPSVGLPSRVAASLFVAILQEQAPNGWAPSLGPLTWVTEDPDRVLAAGRFGQFFWSSEEPQPNMDSLEARKSTRRSLAWEIVPHTAFYLPFVSATPSEINFDSYVLYCDVLILLTALDGNEKILDSLARTGVRSTPFQDRWAWRSRIHLPLEAWASIEKILRWGDSPKSDLTDEQERLVGSLADLSCDTLSRDDFLPERIDVHLSSSSDIELVRTISSSGELHGPKLPVELRIADTTIMDELVVRIGQVDAWPPKDEVRGRFPAVSSKMANSMIEQASNAFLAPSQGKCSEGSSPNGYSSRACYSATGDSQPPGFGERRGQRSISRTILA